MELEEIKEDEISDILGTISETSIEKYLQEQSLLKDKAKKQEEENIKLKEEIIKKNIQIQEQEQEKNNYQDRLNKELKEKEEELNKYKEIERKNQNRKEKRKRIWKKIALVFISLILIGLAVYLYFINKKIFGIITGGVGLILSFFGFLGIDFKYLKEKIKKSQCPTREV